MNVRMMSGEIIAGVPKEWRCRKTCRSLNKMEECPALMFDDYGKECVPQICDYFYEDMSGRTITYKSEAGYTGTIYGVSSLKIISNEGKEVLHTGNRGIGTLDELKELVDKMPEFLNMLKEKIE